MVVSKYKSYYFFVKKKLYTLKGSPLAKIGLKENYILGVFIYYQLKKVNCYAYNILNQYFYLILFMLACTVSLNGQCAIFS